MPTDSATRSGSPAKRALACPRCRYSLKGIPGNTCPECGFQISRSRMQFGVAHWKVPAFFVGAAGLAAGIVPAAWALVVVLRASTLLETMDAADRFNTFLLIAWVAGIVTLGIAWINWSGTMAAWARWRHWMAAGACWLVPAGGFVLAYLMGTLK